MQSWVRSEQRAAVLCYSLVRLTAWSSVGAHKAFIATPSYSETGAKFQPVFEESKVKDLVMEHAIFEEPFSVLKALLTSPITEIAQLRGDSKEMVEDAKAKVLALADSIEVPGFHGLKVGKVVEVENALLLVGGWDSVEVCKHMNPCVDTDSFLPCRLMVRQARRAYSKSVLVH